VYSLTSTTAPSALWPADLPLLAGAPPEGPFERAHPVGRHGAFALYRDGPWLVGRAEADPAGWLEESTRALYEELFAACDGLHLCRVWNHVPGINRRGPSRLERYRAFCSGRSRAFEEAFGPAFHARLPAASAVGSEGAALAVAFVAAEVAPRHVENPEQVPAYRYPTQHGPRSPSFARATVVPGPDAADVFVSGTAAVVGHETVAPGDAAGQLAPTLRNLRLISEACGAGRDLGRGRCAERHLRVYLRRAADLTLVSRVLARELLAPDDRVSYLRAEVCRAELDLEIEVTLLGLGPPAPGRG
jgi:chorismate lyase/3-hydroxybenzoate synthase